MRPQLSVVIPMHNGADVIEMQLDALLGSLADVGSSEILVIDNRSTDGAPDVVRRWAMKHGAALTVIDAHDKAGEPHARNVGWRAASADLVAYCDADDAVGPEWALAMVNGLTTHRYLTGPLDTYKLNDPGVADLRGQALFRALPKLPSGIPFAHGCNMGFRRETLEQLGGFDETFMIGCDIEIAVRAHLADITLGWDEHALVHYRLRSNPRSVFRQARAYGQARHRIDALQASAPPSFTWGHQIRRMGWLAKHSPGLLRFNRRMKWAWVAGQMVGELEGELRP